jgi:hypothetical protein
MKWMVAGKQEIDAEFAARVALDAAGLGPIYVPNLF